MKILARKFLLAIFRWFRAIKKKTLCLRIKWHLNRRIEVKLSSHPDSDGSQINEKNQDKGGPDYGQEN